MWSSDIPVQRGRRRANTLDSGRNSIPSSPASIRHIRSRSYRVTSQTSRGNNDDDADFYFRGRVSTMPTDYLTFRSAGCFDRVSNNSSSSPVYLLRNFSTNDRGQVVNRGDFWRESSSGSRSNTSVGSNDSTKSSLRASSSGPHPRPTGNKISYRVMVLGDSDVGKSSLIAQFMTSDYVNAYEITDVSDNHETKSVSILLDGEEYHLSFIDQIDETDFQDTLYDADAFVVMYSITSRQSFENSIDSVRELRSTENGFGGGTVTKPIVIVANKCDLVRSREVTTEEARCVARSYNCKFAEVSAALKHNVDHLLVGIVSQIRLKIQQQLEENSRFVQRPTPFRRRLSTKSLFGSSAPGSKCFLGKLFSVGHRSKSCENMHKL